MARSFAMLRSALPPLLLLVAACDRQVAAPDQATPTPTPVGPIEGAPVPIDMIGQIDRGHKGETPPPVTFADPDGKPVSIAAFKGKPVLVNLWATWCGPCVKEMPTLDAAAKDFTVVAISQDKDRPTVDAWFAKAGLKRLRPYLDEKLGLSIAYNASLPTSILVDSSGREVWRIVGGMDWTSPSARALLAEAR